MIVHFQHKEIDYKADLNQPLEIGIEVQRDHGVSCFGIENAAYKTYVDGNFIGSKDQGAGCNLETITFTPHGNSTHTECLGHISLDKEFVNDCILDKHYVAQLHTFKTTEVNGDTVLDFTSLNFDKLRGKDSLVIRTLPNSVSKINQDYSGKDTPYIIGSDMQKIVDAGIKHIILDLPSVDKEWDGGELMAHHIFWQYPKNPRLDASITEFAFVSDEISDGLYLLKLNIANFVSDAAPSRPILYKLLSN